MAHKDSAMVTTGEYKEGVVHGTLAALLLVWLKDSDLPQRKVFSLKPLFILNAFSFRVRFYGKSSREAGGMPILFDGAQCL